MAAIGERRIPIDRRVEPWFFTGQRIGNDMRRGERLARERTLRLVETLRLADWIFLHRATGERQLDRQYRVAFHGLSLGTSSHFFWRQLFRPSSASCTPLAPSSSPQRNGPSPASCLRKSSHCTLKALS